MRRSKHAEWVKMVIEINNRAFTIKTVLLALQFCLILHTSEFAYISDRKTSNNTTHSNNACPNYCSCDKIHKMASCSSYYKGFLLSDIPKDYTVHSLTLFGGLDVIPGKYLALPGLQNLDLSRNSLFEIGMLQFSVPESLRFLDLSSNNIKSISSTAFGELLNLEDLSLSENRIEELDSRLFQNLVKLKRLTLSFNNIYCLPSGAFDNLHVLEELDLRSNRIHWFSGEILRNLTRLNSINLSDNKLWTISNRDLTTFGKIDRVSLSGNPWFCSCDITNFIEFIKRNKNTTVNADLVLCNSPQRLGGRKMIELNEGDLKCDGPLIEQMSTSHMEYNGAVVSLDCTHSADNHGVGYWITSKGVKLTSKYHIEYLAQLNISTMSEKVYTSPRTQETSRVSVSENNTLTIRNFANGLGGMYVCTYINNFGNETGGVQLSATSKLFIVEWMSVFFGAMCAVGALLFGLVVGTIKLCAIHVCKCRCAQPNRKKKSSGNQCEEALKPNSLMDSVEQSEVCSLEGDPLLGGDDEFSSSQDTSTVENENTTITVVKTKLGKKIKKVRNRGSQYLTTIKDTSSQAASRVKAGVFLGVEQMRSGVMSMKEFCGTGEIAQTVSIMSVNTDVDSEERSTLISKVTTF
ncbi:leucine-rich repeat-containing protein 4C-like isoform X2 [Ostrea edulis]|uniref:leucine-rich repeat-containing protein 4C-like isoform X2 n=1 Tax=Ostrea edulis TaxID=37623 RepID=UPI0024AEAC00|nr:leucine-rich repeat-containing protein 4C-like isoform X2 [Ostrea edulis]